MIASSARAVWEPTWIRRITIGAEGWLGDAFHKEARSEYLKIKMIVCDK